MFPSDTNSFNTHWEPSPIPNLSLGLVASEVYVFLHVLKNKENIINVQLINITVAGKL